MSVARQNWNPKSYLRHAAFVPALGQGVLDALQPQPGERILDLGCGEGLLSEKIAQAGADVLGIDASPEQIKGTKARGITAKVMNAHDIHFQNEFDAVFSNAALHWMGPLEAVFANVFRALKPGGRFVAEMGGAGNVDSIRQALHAALKQRGVHDPSRHDPWTFLDVETAKRLLQDTGFVVSFTDVYQRPTVLPGDVKGWLTTFGGAFLHAVAPSERNAVLQDVYDGLKSKLVNEDGVWVADYVRLKFEAYKPVQP